MGLSKNVGYHQSVAIIKVIYQSCGYHIFRQPHMFATLVRAAGCFFSDRHEPKTGPSMDAAADGHSFVIYFLAQIYIIGIIDQSYV